MTRPVLARAAACLAAVGSVTLAAVLVPVPTAVAAPGDSPLTVSLETMTPSVIPRRGTVTLSGEVTNSSAETWTDVQAYLMISDRPITTASELDAAAGTGPATEVGGRLTREGLFDEIGDLDPGETTSYTLSVPRKELGITGEPGAYWIGIHVLGAVDGVRDTVADGRARSFIPLMNDRGPRTEVAIVIPLRDRVRRSSEGRLLGLRRWQTMLSPDGRLDRLAEFAAESERPLTWLVDPAVLDAAGSVARDDPPLFTGDDGSGPAADGEPSATPSPSASADADGGTGSDEVDDEPTDSARDAVGWLAEFAERTSGSTVLALPYGDVDVAGVTGNRLGRLQRLGTKLSARTLETLQIDGSPVIAPPSGWLPPRALGALDPAIPVLLSDLAYPDGPGPVLERPDGAEIVLLDSASASGGPGPNDPQDPLALRQRILAEAAVQALSLDRDQPLVVATPPYWKLGGAWEGADFFDGLDVPWLTQVDLGSLLARNAGEESADPPSYPARERRRHVPFANQLAAQELVDVGVVYADLLSHNDSVRDDLAKAAMLTTSYTARSDASAALERARNTTLRIRRTLQQVDIDGPPFVMMSSETGPISVTVVNNLDEPVTVRLEAITSRDDLEIASPDPISLGPGQRTPVRMRAQSTAIGVHEVTLVATTESGRRLGSEVQFNVRTSNVGMVIWLVMGIGGGLLLVMIAFRILRRVRTHRQSGTT